MASTSIKTRANKRKATNDVDSVAGAAIDADDSLHIDELLKKQEKDKFTKTVEHETDMAKVDFDKIDELIEHHLSGAHVTNTDVDDEIGGIPDNTKTEVAFLNQTSPFGWRWTFNDRTVR